MMARTARLALALLASACTSMALAQDADPGAVAQRRGWLIYLEAREAAGARSQVCPLRDYTYELRARNSTPQGEVELSSKGYFVYPNVVRQEIDAPSGRIVLVSNGEKIWQVLPEGPRYLPSTLAQQFHSDLARAHVLFGEPPRPGSVRFLRQEGVEGRRTDVIEFGDVGGAPLVLFVDAETRDVVKMMYVGEVPGGVARVEEFFSDFQEAGGFRWSQRSRVFRNGRLSKQSTRTIQRVNGGLSRSELLR